MQMRIGGSAAGKDFLGSFTQHYPFPLVPPSKFSSFSPFLDCHWVHRTRLYVCTRWLLDWHLFNL